MSNKKTEAAAFVTYLLLSFEECRVKPALPVLAGVWHELGQHQLDWMKRSLNCGYENSGNVINTLLFTK